MKPSNEGKTAIDLALATTNATALHSLDIDVSGSDTVNFYVSCGSHDSATEGIDTISVYESDTVTQATSMTLIAALSSGTATSTSAGNILPTAAVMALGGIVQEIQVDLLKRNKKYLGIAVQTGPVAAGMPYCTLARLTRNEQSADTAVQKDKEDLGATNVSGCMQVVSE